MLSVNEALDAVLTNVEWLRTVAVPLSNAQGMYLGDNVIADVDSPPFDKALMDGYAVLASDITGQPVELEVIDEVTAGRVPQRSIASGQATRIMTGAPLPTCKAGSEAGALESICVIKIEDTESLDEGARVRILAQSVSNLGARNDKTTQSVSNLGARDDHTTQSVSNLGARDDRTTQSVSNLGARNDKTTQSTKPEQNLIRQGTNMRSGDVVLSAGRRLRAQELAALAEMGTHKVAVHRRPEVAVLATGDELVGVDQQLGPGQIRNSNETMLVGQIQQAGATAVPLGVARDEREHLRTRISEGLKYDVLLLSGGVSAGKLDLVPSELERAGVQQVFHKVQVKPGKPVWFGVLQQEDHVCYVFGLPGNPVSSMVCFELFVRVALRKLMGDRNPQSAMCRARLTHSHIHKDKRATYFPAFVDETSDRFEVTLMKWHGSSDLQSTTNANAMAVFPAEPKDYELGDVVPVIRW
jgi:molybdopterin molybdotransferase